MLFKKPKLKTPPITINEELYKEGVGSNVPGGHTSKRRVMEIWFWSINKGTSDKGAPNVDSNKEGSTLDDKSVMASVLACDRRVVMVRGPSNPAVLQAVSKRPWIPPTCLFPNMSLR